MKIATRSAARSAAIAVVAAPILLCVGVYAYAAHGKAKLSLRPNPSTRTVKGASSTQFRAAIRRSHFSGRPARLG
jgi:hypothetical protein